MIKNYTSVHTDDLYSIAEKIIEDAGELRIFELHGRMGAGKTTLIKSLCKVLGVTDHVTSPTFSILNEYSNGKPVYHFDFYRINSVSEAFDLGYENYFFSGCYCFIEWPEKIESLLNIAKAAIFITSEINHRIIKLQT